LKPLPQVAQCSSADASHPQLETTDEAITQSENNPVQIDDSADMVETPATLPPDEGKQSNHSDANHTNVTPQPHSPEITQESLLTNPAEDTNTGFTNSSPEPTPLSGRVVRKRKVLRKQVDGTPRVFDESLVEDMRGGRGRYRLHDLSVDDSDPRLLHISQMNPFNFHHVPIQRDLWPSRIHSLMHSPNPINHLRSSDRTHLTHT